MGFLFSIILVSCSEKSDKKSTAWQAPDRRHHEPRRQVYSVYCAPKVYPLASSLQDNIKANVLKRIYTIRSYEVSPDGRLSVPSVFNLLQDIASSHALDLGVAISQLLTGKLTWVLSRIFLKMTSYPEWRDSVEIYTWPSGIQRVFALRDFDIRHKGHTIGSCISAWIIIDAGTRRPVRPTPFVEQLSPANRERVLRHPLEKLARLKDPQTEKRFFVQYRDLDINQHVNNVRYIEWLLECVVEKLETERCLAELEINFLGEAVLGDAVLSRSGPINESGTRIAHDVRRESDGQELMRARTVWI